MRFFSNDARESTDEQAQDERPERVQSDPVAVPSQRPPSPWSDKPAADDPAAADTDRRDDVAGSGPNAEAERTDTDRPPFHDPNPQPTAFGASTVGGAVAASATANPANDRQETTDRDAAADSDGVRSSSTNTYAGSTAGTAPDTVPATWTEHEKREGHDHDAAVDLPLDDRTGTDPDASDKTASIDLQPDAPRDDSTVSTVDDDSRPGPDADVKTDSGPLKDDGGFDDPKAVDPVTDTPLDADRTPEDSSPEDSSPGDSPAVDAPPAAAAVPAAAAAAPADTLFDREDARTFQERWRDVQLRFVDSPKDAASEAAGLVDEAVEKLTAGLRSQRDGLANDTDDTEQLRVQLRGYRDILNRILSL